MNGVQSIVGNTVLYAFLLWQLYENTIVEFDPWYAYVVAFVLVVAVLITFIPGLRARAISPGHYPFED